MATPAKAAKLTTVEIGYEYSPLIIQIDSVHSKEKYMKPLGARRAYCIAILAITIPPQAKIPITVSNDNASPVK